MSHTPGPWQLYEFRDTVVVSPGPRHKLWEKSFWKTYIADARLIAAAPDLLEALEWARPLIAMTADEALYDKTRAAIAKAKGEA